MSSSSELIIHSLFWRLPAFILILLLLKKKPSIYIKRDLIITAAALAALCITAFLVSLAATLTGFYPPKAVSPPSGVLGWIGIILLCLSTGCLEEAYFRYYLPERILAANLQRSVQQLPALAAKLPAYLISALVFAFCHVSYGPWGFINALLAALVLSMIYIKSSSFPGIAGAHGLYNIFVYISAIFKY